MYGVLPTYVCVHHSVCSVLRGQKKEGIGYSRWSYRSLSASMWVQETDPVSSGKASSTLVAEPVLQTNT